MLSNIATAAEPKSVADRLRELADELYSQPAFAPSPDHFHSHDWARITRVVADHLDETPVDLLTLDRRGAS